MGVILWQSARNVVLWATTPAPERGALFGNAAVAARALHLGSLEVDAELVGPLSVVSAMMEDAERMDAVRVVNACRRVAAWAERSGLLATALEFMQSAAHAAPDSPGLSFQVGRLARRNAQYDRAESWYARSIVQGRRARDWSAYARAFLGLGNLQRQRGNFPGARKAHERCLRAARRHRLRELEGFACQNLFLLEVETGAGAAAESLAEQAFYALGPTHPQVPRLAYDLAFYWSTRGYFAQSLAVARALPSHFSTTPERAFAWSLVARNAGGVGDRALFDLANRQLQELIASGGAADATHRALLGISLGAANLGDWDLSIDTAEQVLQLARERNEGKVQLDAEAALDAARRGCAASQRRPEIGTVADRLPEPLTLALDAAAACVAA